MNTHTHSISLPDRSHRDLNKHVASTFAFRRGFLPTLLALSLALGIFANGEFANAAIVYWSEDTRVSGSVVSTRIMRAESDGSGLATVYSLGGAEGKIGGIAFDSANGHIYSGTLTQLIRLNLDGTSRVNLVSAINQVGDVEVDLAGGKIYWTEVGGGQNAIRRANLNGSSPQTLLNIGFAGGIEGIGLDLLTGKLYYAQSVNTGNDTIGMMNLDGTGNSVFKTLSGALANPFDVEINQLLGKVYWNQVSSPGAGIYQANFDGSGSYSLQVAPPDGTNNGFGFDIATQMLVVSSTPVNQLSDVQTLALDGTGFGTVASDRPNVNYIEVIPEPSSATLTVSGVLALLGVRRRRCIATIADRA